MPRRGDDDVFRVGDMDLFDTHLLPVRPPVERELRSSVPLPRWASEVIPRKWPRPDPNAVVMRLARDENTIPIVIKANAPLSLVPARQQRHRTAAPSAPAGVPGDALTGGAGAADAAVEEGQDVSLANEEAQAQAQVQPAKVATKNRWLMAASAVCLHLSIGSVYAWSVFSKPLQKHFDASLKQISLTFGIAIFFLGLSAAFMGQYVERVGARRLGMISAALWSIGLLGSGLAVSSKSLGLLYVSYGFVGGMGLGAGYVAPVGTLVRWFPDRRGLATGLAVMGFGFAALVASPLAAHLIADGGPSRAFYTLGVTYFVVMILAAQYIEPPPANWRPAGWTPAQVTAVTAAPAASLSTRDAVRTLPFAALWLMMLINITCGIAVISVASPLAQETTGMSAIAASAIVGLNGMFNGGGRLAWASSSDALGRPVAFMAMFATEVIAFAWLPSARNVLLFQLLLYAIMSCYGGAFACMPAYISDLFGTTNLSALFGLVLTSWSVAGLVGSTLAAHLREETGSYDAMLRIFAGASVISLGVAAAMHLFAARLLAGPPSPAPPPVVIADEAPSA